MVYKLPKMTDMARTPKDVVQSAAISLGMLHDKYPCGLCICLDHNDLEKLDLDDDCEPGDMIHGFFMAKVTSCSKRQNMNGEDECRIELQVTHLGLESEDEENEEAFREGERHEGEGHRGREMSYGDED